MPGVLRALNILTTTADAAITSSRLGSSIAAGVPTEYEGRGNDYTKAPIEEQFEVKDGKARWNG